MGIFPTVAPAGLQSLGTAAGASFAGPAQNRNGTGTEQGRNTGTLED